MNWFKNHKKVYPTKMFVNYLPEASKEETTRTPQTKSGGILSSALGAKGIAIEMLLTAAPKIIDKGMELMADTLESLANDKAFPSTVKRNFDIINPAKLSLPSSITLVRGDFAPNKNMQGEPFGDGKDKSYNQAILSGDKELHIELDIIQSKDKSAFYIQPTSYFYAGQSPQGDSIDEVVLAFAFLKADQNIVDPKKDFKGFLHFDSLSPNHQYNFKSSTGYDSSFQSSWISTPLDDVQPYTLVVKIIEIREGNSFAKLLQTIYMENEKNIKQRLNEQVTSLKT